MYQSFKDFKHRILVSTDIWGRGIDIERVNIVVNYDVPDSPDSYLHRVGRAGRFGTKGLAITFASSDEDAKVLESVLEVLEVSITQLPDLDQIDVYSYKKFMQDPMEIYVDTGGGKGKGGGEDNGKGGGKGHGKGGGKGHGKGKGGGGSSSSGWP